MFVRAAAGNAGRGLNVDLDANGDGQLDQEDLFAFAQTAEVALTELRLRGGPPVVPHSEAARADAPAAAGRRGALLRDALREPDFSALSKPELDGVYHIAGFAQRLLRTRLFAEGRPPQPPVPRSAALDLGAFAAADIRPVYVVELGAAVGGGDVSAAFVGIMARDARARPEAAAPLGTALAAALPAVEDVERLRAWAHVVLAAPGPEPLPELRGAVLARLAQLSAVELARTAAALWDSLDRDARAKGTVALTAGHSLKELDAIGEALAAPAPPADPELEALRAQKVEGLVVTDTLDFLAIPAAAALGIAAPRVSASRVAVDAQGVSTGAFERRQDAVKDQALLDALEEHRALPVAVFGHAPDNDLGVAVLADQVQQVLELDAAAPPRARSPRLRAATPAGAEALRREVERINAAYGTRLRVSP